MSAPAGLPPARKKQVPAASASRPAKRHSPLGLVRLKPPRSFRLRLIDAVTLAACGLLVLKLAGLAFETPESAAPMPSLVRVLAEATSGSEIPDPTTTGSVSPKSEEKKPDAPKKTEPPLAQPAMSEPVSATEKALYEKLGARRDALKARSEDLDLREKMLGEAERKLETGVTGLKEAEDKGDAGGSKKAEAEKAALKNIVTMYETMKPKDAARVFDRLNHEVLVPIVLAMNPRKMAEVLSAMQPETAERLTVALANKARGVGDKQANAAQALPPSELQAIDPSAPAR